MIRALPLLLLAACGGPSDAELRARAAKLAATADPAITAALADPIMSDPDLTVADNSRRVRIVGGPAQAYYPLRNGKNAEAFAALRALGGPRTCEIGFKPGPAFADELPPAFRAPAGATLIEAAGNDRPECRARFVLFRTPASAETLAAQVRARARAARPPSGSGPAARGPTTLARAGPAARRPAAPGPSAQAAPRCRRSAVHQAARTCPQAARWR